MAFSILNESSTRNSRFNLKQQTVRFKLNPMEQDVENPEQWLKDGLQAIYDQVTHGINPHNKVAFTFSGLDRDFHVPLKKASLLNFEDLWTELYKIYQSNKGGVEGDNFTITATSLGGIQGSGLVSHDVSSSVTNSTQQEGISLNSHLISQEERKSKTSEQVAYELGKEADSREECICSSCSRSYPNTGRNCCDKCFIKSGQSIGKWIAYNPSSWESYENFKKWQYTYDRKKIACPGCKKKMLRTSLYRHQKICNTNRCDSP